MQCCTGPKKSRNIKKMCRKTTKYLKDSISYWDMVCKVLFCSMLYPLKFINVILFLIIISHSQFSPLMLQNIIPNIHCLNLPRLAVNHLSQDLTFKSAELLSNACGLFKLDWCIYQCLAFAFNVDPLCFITTESIKQLIFSIFLYLRNQRCNS